MVSSLQKIFGSNLLLSAREVSGNALTPGSYLHGGTAGEARNFGSLGLVRRVGFEPTETEVNWFTANPR